MRRDPSPGAAILFAPTLLGTVYGMNFTHFPGSDSPFGFYAAMLAMAVILCILFKRRHWL